MDVIGDSALKVLEYINSRGSVTNAELVENCTGNPLLDAAVLVERKFVFPKMSPANPYDYQISPLGADYLEQNRSRTELIERVETYHNEVLQQLSEMNARIDAIQAQMIDADKANAKAARIAQIIGIVGVVFAGLSLVVAIVTAIIK